MSKTGKPYFEVFGQPLFNKLVDIIGKYTVKVNNMV